MINTIKKLLGLGPRADFQQLIRSGAIILDVRTKGEFQGGHLKNAISIPLQDLQNQLNKLDKQKPIITCCASGMRSASAKSILRSHGFSEVHNGGSWRSLQRYQ